MYDCDHPWDTLVLDRLNVTFTKGSIIYVTIFHCLVCDELLERKHAGRIGKVPDK
jgi:hypothetical protein